MTLAERLREADKLFTHTALSGPDLILIFGLLREAASALDAPAAVGVDPIFGPFTVEPKQRKCKPAASLSAALVPEVVKDGIVGLAMDAKQIEYFCNELKHEVAMLIHESMMPDWNAQIDTLRNLALSAITPICHNFPLSPHLIKLLRDELLSTITLASRWKIDALCDMALAAVREVQPKEKS